MENEILLSIIIPVYNLEDYIIPCLESVIHNENVSTDSFEVIVVNDGSSDASRQRVEEFINTNKGFQISLYSQENKGVSVARNLGLEKAQGKYVWFVDGDDAIFRKSIQLLTEIIRNFDIDVIRAGATTVLDILFEDNAVIPNYNVDYKPEQYKEMDACLLLKEKYQVSHTLHIWKRIFLIDNQLKYPVGVFQNEDVDFLYHALLAAHKAYVNLSYNFYISRIRIGSVTRTGYTFLKWDKLIYDKFFVLNDLLKEQGRYQNQIVKSELLAKCTNRYIYGILALLFFEKAPFVFILYCIRKLKILELYPLPYRNKRRYWQTWLMNHRLLFMMGCWIYRLKK